MTDIRIISKSDLDGIWADWLYGGKSLVHEEFGGQLFHFAQKFFGARYFGNRYFANSWRKSVTLGLEGRVDWMKLGNKALDETHELGNVVLVALLTNSLADATEILPDPDSTDRQGWWGDLEAEVIWDGWPIGCKNWLLTRAKITGAGSREGSTLVRAEEYTRTALQPMIDKRLCSNINVRAERVELDRIEVSVTIYRGPLEEIELKFQNLWTEITEE